MGAPVCVFHARIKLYGLLCSTVPHVRMFAGCKVFWYGDHRDIETESITLYSYLGKLQSYSPLLSALSFASHTSPDLESYLCE